MYQCKVIIPIYKKELSDNEQLSLDNTIHKLSRYPIVFLTNNQENVETLLKKYSMVEYLIVSDNWLGSKRGIQGYNEMMMSKEFYELFMDTEYILICHVDAWIFRDELDKWCNAGYDVVAAPWPTRFYYRLFPFKQITELKKKIFHKNEIIHSDLRGRVGNGGLSLRRVKSFRDACVKYADVIKEFIKKRENEDVFWSIVPTELRYPLEEEALKFAYDVKPRLSHKVNNEKLPMGCHGYAHSERISFWQQYIPCVKSSTPSK